MVSNPNDNSVSLDTFNEMMICLMEHESLSPIELLTDVCSRSESPSLLRTFIHFSKTSRNHS